MPEFETRHADWLAFDEALARVLDSVRPLPPAGEPCSLHDLEPGAQPALAQAVVAPATLPPGPSSAMDGYAVAYRTLQGADPPFGPLPVVGVSRPGAPHRDPLPEGAATRIMTGALLPRGADTVIPVEDTDAEAEGRGRVRIHSRPERGQRVRPTGEEMQEGETLALPGDALTPPLTALLISAGVEEVAVVPRPRIAVLVTGDELVGRGAWREVRRGVVRADALSPALPHFIHEAGGLGRSPVRVPDRLPELIQALEEAAREADLVLTTGGASMGEGDLLKRALDELGHEPDFWRARIRPGSPVSLGRLGGVPVLGLPGNPVSAMVTFLLLGRPAVRKLAGYTRLFLPRIRVRAAEELKGARDLTLFLRVRLHPDAGGGWNAFPTGPQGSGITGSLARADALAVVPEGVATVDRGEELVAILLPTRGRAWEVRGGEGH
jgi:molybdopterin molybdotransferase